MFANIILADEINRTPPRTQAALLEAMQEYQVTVGGVRYALERPLFVLATENPIEQEGTYPLPEAQLDRFMFNVVIDYPDADDERRILAETTTSARSRGEARHDRRGARGGAHARARAAGCGERRRLRAASDSRDAPGRSHRAAAGERVGALGRRSARRPGAVARRQGVRRCSTVARCPRPTTSRAWRSPCCAIACS